MKKLLLVLLCLPILFFSCSEKKVIWDKVYFNEDDKLFYYSSAPFSGVRYANNQFEPNLEAKQYFLDGKRIWHKEYRDNKLRFEQYFNNEDEYKSFKRYYENGNLKSEGVYYQEDRYVKIIDISYKTIFSTPYTKSKEYYENGELKFSCEANKDENSYFEKSYYENGKLQNELIFKDFRKIVKKYSESGDLTYITPTWNCINGNCVDPGDGLGESLSLKYCQVHCK